MVVGVIGAGNVTGQYLPSLLSYPDIQVRGIADLDTGRAAGVAAEYGLPFSGTAAELLAIDDIELVVNLTTPAAHAEVALAVIESGRHLWGEKPLTMDRESAGAVLAAAAAAGVAVGNAPDTILGPAIQNSQRLLAEGAIGAPQTVLTLMQGPGPDRWHPRPQFLFARGAGPLFDIGPYYLTTMVQLLGPIAKVEAAGHRARAERVIGAGPRRRDHVPGRGRHPRQRADHVPVRRRRHLGLQLRLRRCSRQAFEISGAHGTLEVPVSGFDGPTRLLREPGPDASWETVAPPGESRDRGVGVLEMARAIRAGRPPRASGQLAFHVLDVLLAIEESAASGQPVPVTSTAGPVPPLDEDWSPSDRATLQPERTSARVNGGHHLLRWPPAPPRPSTWARPSTRSSGRSAAWPRPATCPGPGRSSPASGPACAAACAPVWVLRSRGIHSWRLGAGDYPLPFPRSRHPVVGVSQSGRSAETLAVLESVEQELRYAVVNTAPSPIADVARTVIDLGNIPDSYASTVGYTATVAALGILADAWDQGGADPGWQTLAAAFAEAEQRAHRAGDRSWPRSSPRPGPPTSSAPARRSDRLRRPPCCSARWPGCPPPAWAPASTCTAPWNRPATPCTSCSATSASRPWPTPWPRRATRSSWSPPRTSSRAGTWPLSGCRSGPPAQRAILEVLVMQILVAAVADLLAVDIEEFVFHNSDTKVSAARSWGVSAISVADHPGNGRVRGQHGCLVREAIDTNGLGVAQGVRSGNGATRSAMVRELAQACVSRDFRTARQAVPAHVSVPLGQIGAH